MMQSENLSLNAGRLLGAVSHWVHPSVLNLGLEGLVIPDPRSLCTRGRWAALGALRGMWKGAPGKLTGSCPLPAWK